MPRRVRCSKLDLGGAISSGPAVVNDMVYVGAGTGVVVMGQQQQGVYGLALQRQGATTTTTTPGASTTTTTTPATRVTHIPSWSATAVRWCSRPPISPSTSVTRCAGVGELRSQRRERDQRERGQPVLLTVQHGCDNPPLSSGGATYEHTFAQAGTFPYYCSVHFSLGMTGTITVQ